MNIVKETQDGILNGAIKEHQVSDAKGLFEKIMTEDDLAFELSDNLNNGPKSTLELASMNKAKLIEYIQHLQKMLWI